MVVCDHEAIAHVRSGARRAGRIRPAAHSSRSVSADVCGCVGADSMGGMGFSRPRVWWVQLLERRTAPKSATAIPASRRRLVSSFNNVMPSSPASAGLVATSGTTTAAGPEVSARR